MSQSRRRGSNPPNASNPARRTHSMRPRTTSTVKDAAQRKRAADEAKVNVALVEHNTPSDRRHQRQLERMIHDRTLAEQRLNGQFIVTFPPWSEFVRACRARQTYVFNSGGGVITVSLKFWKQLFRMMYNCFKTEFAMHYTTPSASALLNIIDSDDFLSREVYTVSNNGETFDMAESEFIINAFLHLLPTCMQPDNRTYITMVALEPCSVMMIDAGRSYHFPTETQPQEGERSFVISGLCTATAYRNQGYAQLLAQHVLSRQTEDEVFYCTVLKDANVAENILKYTQYGFKEVTSNDNYVLMRNKK